MNDQRPADVVGRIAGAAVARLQNSRETSGRTAGALATLRRAHNHAPGADPELWELVIAPVEAETTLTEMSRRRDQAEQAIHTALCLYATHQQSRADPMHVSGIGFGTAVGRLEALRPAKDDGLSPVRRRFNAVATSSDPAETAHHLRGLVAQMRGDNIGLDYARLARDLFLLAHPGAADSVRRQWGRDLYHRPALTPPPTLTQGAS